MPTERTVTEAHEWLAENSYDVSPVVDGDQPLGYIAIDHLAEGPGSETVSEHRQAITLEEIIVRIQNYVITHEMAQAVHGEHSDSLWNTVGALIPDYEDRREWLRANGNTLAV